jgi:hypothetical protein
VTSIRSIVALAAAASFAVAAYAEPAVAEKKDERPAASQPAHAGGFKQEVKRAWSDTRAGIHRAGREIRDGAKAAGHSTAEAFRSGWRKVKESFAGTPQRADGAG